MSKQAVRAFLAALGAAGDTTIVLTTHDLADIERLCRRLVVIDQGRIVHDGSLEDLHGRYGSRRRLVVDLDEPLTVTLALPGVTVESTQADGRRITYVLDGTATAGDLVSRLAEVAALRDISVLEPRTWSPGSTRGSRADRAAADRPIGAQDSRSEHRI